MFSILGPIGDIRKYRHLTISIIPLGRFSGPHQQPGAGRPTGFDRLGV